MSKLATLASALALCIGAGIATADAGTMDFQKTFDSFWNSLGAQSDAMRSATNEMGATTAASPLACEIRVLDQLGKRRLEAVVTATMPMPATYQFDIGTTKAGRSATATRANTVNLVPGTWLVGGADVKKGSQTSASLTLTWVGGSTSCTAQR
mgnify:CR=1 FL=1